MVLMFQLPLCATFVPSNTFLSKLNIPGDIDLEPAIYWVKDIPWNQVVWSFVSKNDNIDRSVWTLEILGVQQWVWDVGMK